MDPYTAAELARLEDALLRFSPSRQWELKAVTFPSTANTDIDIAHSLTPGDAETVDYLVLQSAQPVVVYHDRSSTRTAWSDGVIRLRATAPSAQVILLLTVRPVDQETHLLGTVDSETTAFTVPTLSADILTVTGRVVASGDENEFQPAFAGDIGNGSPIGDSFAVHLVGPGTADAAGLQVFPVSEPRLLLLLQDNTSVINYQHNSSSSSSAIFRFKNSRDGTVQQQPNEGLLAYYDLDNARWRLIGLQCEVGSWTPTLRFGGATTGITYDTQAGSYTRIGNVVYANFRIKLTSQGSATGTADITGLPFTEANARDIGWLDIPTNTGPASTFTGTPYIVISGGTLFPVQAGGAATRTQLSDAYFADDLDMRGSITYRI